MRDPTITTKLSTARFRHVTTTLNVEPFFAPNSIKHVHSSTMMEARGLMLSLPPSGTLANHTGSDTPSSSKKKIA